MIEPKAKKPVAVERGDKPNELRISCVDASVEAWVSEESRRYGAAFCRKDIEPLVRSVAEMLGKPYAEPQSFNGYRCVQLFVGPLWDVDEVAAYLESYTPVPDAFRAALGGGA